MILAASTHGDGRDATFLHGFTQTRESWLPVVRRLDGVRATLVDAPGHGGSPDGSRSLWQAADDVAETMPRGVLVGYSMGARIALHTALSHPDRVTALVLVSGTAGIEDPAERDARRRSDGELASRIESIGVPAFLDEWLANPMFAGLDAASAMLHDRLRNTAQGLAASLRNAGTGTQDDLWPRLSGLHMPVLLVCGALDTKFVSIARRMHGLIPGSALETVEGAGHTVHLEDTEGFVQVLDRWFSARAQ